MEPLHALSAASAPESAAPPQPGLSTNSPKFIQTPPKSGSPPQPTSSIPGSAPISLQQSTPPLPIPPARPPAPAPTSGTPGGSGGSGTPSSNPRLRSSIACARCRRSKIKCTNAGAGTTCEACAHSNRECVYPAPGASSGSEKRGAHGEDGSERLKRPRTKKVDPFSGANIERGPRDAAAELGRAPFAPMSGPGLQALLLRDSIWNYPVLKFRVWNEVFDLFQLHYGTELPFLHAPTFLPKLTDSLTTEHGTMSQHSSSRSGEELLGKQLIGLGLLALTARFHEELVEFHWNALANNANASHKDPSAASDHYASALRNTLLSEQVFSDPHPTLEKVQALLMLTLYDWSLSRGVQASVYLGIAIRMAQAVGLFYEDMDPSETWLMGFANENSNLRVSANERLSPGHNTFEYSSSDIFVEEESRRRTAWSCFVLDKYTSNGSFRPSVLSSTDMHVQLPCGEKAWAFGERVCTPFLSGQCSHNGERTAKKMRLLRRKREWRTAQESSQPADRAESDMPAHKRTFEDSENSKVPCELDESEGLLSRFVKISEIWGKVARKTHAGAPSVNRSGAKGSITAAFEIEAALHQYKESSPRSFRPSESNIRAHSAQRTLPPFTLLNAIHAISRLVLYRDSLVFLPITIESPVELDETDHGMDTPLKRQRKAASIQKFFAAACDFLNLFEACRTQRLLPGTPMMGFGLYLVSFAGVYAYNFPHMDSEGAVCGSDSFPRTILDAQANVLEALKTLAQMRFQLPIAQHWFRTLQRLHTYYRRAANDYKTSPQLFSRPLQAVRRTQTKTAGNATLSASNLEERSEAIVCLDVLFKELGNAEDDLQRTSPLRPGEAYPNVNGVPPHPASRTPDIWNPVNNNLSIGEPYNPSTGPPQHYPPLYQQQSPTPTSGSPPSLLPPLTASIPPSGPSSSSYPVIPSAPAPVTYHWTSMQQPISGEDVAAFVDGRSEAEWASMKASWELVRNDDAAAAASSNQETRLWGRDAPKPGWYGVLWGWI